MSENKKETQKYISSKEQRERYNEKNRVKITCDICNKKYEKWNKYHHEKTMFHQHTILKNKISKDEILKSSLFEKINEISRVVKKNFL